MTQYDQNKARRLNAWTRRKIRIHNEERNLSFWEREIWWSSLGENIGDEANGKHEVFERPVIILKRFSRNLVLVVPVTTQAKSGSWFHPFLLRDEPRWAVLVQVRVISTKRLVRCMGTIEAAAFARIKTALIDLIN